ncbi:hypothetical protein TRAPUB_7060 [Trametes pubescens]|uniref:Uncharacterized protein n=1 Tax=Trametes pubescens TaxID=154538 RepID=A0A1M2V4F7_TRAPU|nr:hypothetical protein TRAPUB_7060 [Trametes pubescens]
MVRIDAFTRRKDSDQWTALSSDYQRILEQTRRSSTKLVAAIKVYLSLQKDVTSDETDAMIAELDSLKTSVADYSFDQRSSLEDLVARAGHLKYEIQQAVDARRTAVSHKMEEADDTVASCKKQLKDLHAQHVATSRGVVKESESGLLSYIPDIFRGSAPDRADSSTQTDEQSTRRKTRRQRTLDAQEQVSAYVSDSRTLEEQIQRAEATLADAQARYAKKQASLRLFERAGWEATRNAMHTIIVHLTKRTEHMSALVSLRKQLLLEIGAYKQAFEAVKTYPTSTRQAVLKQMQERVASTASAWNGVAAQLANEYAKGYN